MKRTASDRIWTVTEAKARLSEILRRAENEGPQWIGKRRSFVLVPAELWQRYAAPRPPLGAWLVKNMPRGLNLEIPDRQEPERSAPFTDGENA